MTITSQCTALWTMRTTAQLTLFKHLIFAHIHCMHAYASKLPAIMRGTSLQRCAPTRYNAHSCFPQPKDRILIAYRSASAQRRQWIMGFGSRV